MNSNQSIFPQEANKPQRGIQSVEVGARLLQALAQAQKPLALGDLALAADMLPAQAYTYLVSLLRLGLVKRDPVSDQFEPGPLSLRLGLQSLEHLPAYRHAVPVVQQLAKDLGFSIAMCIPGTRGPTIVRYEHAGFPLHVNLHVGSVMALRTTATGRLFCAYASVQELEAASQMQHTPEEPADAFAQELQDIRARGLARSINLPSPGISSLCAPVFDAQQRLCLSLTVIGSTGAINVDWDGAIAHSLLATCKSIQQQIHCTT